MPLTGIATIITNGAVAEQTPLDYGTLKIFADAENGVVTSSDDVTSWTDEAASEAFTVPANGASPKFESSVVNGLPGINFQQPTGVGNGFLSRKLSANANVVDNFFGGSGNKAIAFAGKLNRLTDNVFNTRSTIISKGFNNGTGWSLSIDANGSMEFQHKFGTSGSSAWKIKASGFYKVNDLVLGYIRYSGGNSTGSGILRLYNNNSGEFVTVGSVTTASGSRGSDSSFPLVLGSIIDPTNGNNHAPFEGPLFGVWMTKAADVTFDEDYMSRWL